MKEVLTDSQLCMLMLEINCYDSNSDTLEIYKDKVKKLIDEERVSAFQAYQLGLIIGMADLKISLCK